MSTTNLFAELIVIGTGAITWVMLLILSIFGYQWVPLERLFSISALVPILSSVYVLGIIFDRISDTVFEKWWGDGLRRVWFKEKKQYHNARLRILFRSERLWNLLEYGRSRLRICRGWALNSVLIAISINIFVWTRLYEQPFAMTLSVSGTLAMLLLALSSWYAWRKLTLTEYRKIQEQLTLLPDSSSEEQTKDPL